MLRRSWVFATTWVLVTAFYTVLFASWALRRRRLRRR